MKTYLTFFTTIAAIMLYLTSSTFAAPLSAFEERTVDSSPYPYRLYIPTNYDPNKSYPVLTYYHSSGQQSAATTVGHPNVTDCYNWAKNPEHEAFIYVPFVHSVNTMVDVLNDLSAEFNIDRTRVYTTGWSYGAIYSFQAIGDRPDQFAAAAPMAGWTTNPAEDYINTPIWAFNGTADGTTPPSGVVPTFNEAWALGSTVLYTEVPGGTHTTTPRTGYAQPGLFPWMFAQSTDQPHDLSMFLAFRKDTSESLNINAGQSFDYPKEYFIGYYGNATVNLSNGGVMNTGDGYIAVNGLSTSNVTLTGNGSQWNVDGDLYVGYDGPAKGTLDIGFGSHVEVENDLSVAIGSKINFSGGSLHATMLTLDGHLAIDLEQLATGNPASINIDGYARLEGYVDIAPINDFNSVVGKKITILTYGSKSGTLHDFGIVDLGDDQLLIPQMTGTSLKLTATFNGDTNLDGKVDLVDLVTVGEHYNQYCNEGYACGDFSGNGNVSLNDLVTLGENWGRGVVVPEPTSIAFLGLASFGLLIRKR